jgi:hypothetical protein
MGELSVLVMALDSEQPEVKTNRPAAATEKSILVSGGFATLPPAADLCFEVAVYKLHSYWSTLPVIDRPPETGLTYHQKVLGGYH